MVQSLTKEEIVYGKWFWKMAEVLHTQWIYYQELLQGLLLQYIYTKLTKSLLVYFLNVFLEVYLV